MTTLTARHHFNPLLAIAMCSAQAGAAPPAISGCQVLPPNNVWNRAITDLPVHPDSAAYINTIGANIGLHPDFGTVYEGAPIGIPYVVVPADQPLVNITFQYAGESDPGPYPIPPNPPIEGGPDSTGDRHILIIQAGACKLFEIFAAYPNTDGTWHAGSGAIFDLNSNGLRPDTWTSADAAGLPILPGLVRYEEVQVGVIDHALRFTAEFTQSAHLWPARHDASDDSNPNYPPMGTRFRLKASFNIAPFPQEVKVILTALKTYGMFLADNGSNWYISGVPNPLWNDDALHQLNGVHGSDFEAVDESSLMIDADSGQAAVPGDINHDGQIGPADLAQLLAGWGQCPPPPGTCPADLNHDSAVGPADLAQLLASWS